MDDDKILSKITKLLEQGCTMLATHHDCGAPLFRCHGDVVCPVCSYADGPSLPAKMQPSSLPKMETDKKSKSDHVHLQGSEKINEESMTAMGNLRASLLHRLQELTVAMEDEHDLDKLKKLLDCLDGLLRVLRYLQG
jgi:UPF0148 protein